MISLLFLGVGAALHKLRFAWWRRGGKILAPSPRHPVCFGGPLDGMELPPLGARETWQCVEYPDARGFLAVNPDGCLRLHSTGEVYWRGVYHRDGARYTYHPMRSQFCNTLQRRTAYEGES